MSRVRRLDHVGVTVDDLDLVSDFFVRLGLEVEGRTFVEGEFLDVVSGIPDSRCEVVTLRPPGGGTALELSRYVRPESTPADREAVSTLQGLRNVCFEVTGLEDLVAELAADGYSLVGGIGRYEDQWLMAYVRGPEGIIVAIAERVG